MRIVEHFDIMFSGEGYFTSHRDFEIVSDSGEYHQISIPNILELTETFLYMNENDCLRHLVTLEPRIITNEEEIERVQRYNEHKEQQAYRNRTVERVIDPVTLETNIVIPGLRDEPQPTWQAVWTFRSKQHAVMVKLAMGGRQ